MFTRKAIEIVSFRSSFGVLRRIQVSQPSFPPFWHFSDHALIDQTDDSRVRVIEASENWPVEHVRRSMKEG